MTKEQLDALVWKDWKLEEKIGSGSFGDVYKASKEQHGIKTYSAIKTVEIPRDEDKEELLAYSKEATETYVRKIVDDCVNEIRLMESLKGTGNAVGIEDYKVEELIPKEKWCILIRMELLTSLTKYQETHPLEEKDIVRLGIDISNVLNLCRSRNIIHRDIKAANIFVNEFGDFKLGDFGIARRLDEFQNAHTRLGTLNYIAPEVFNGQEYSWQADIYSLGMVLYLLSNHNRLPFWPQDEMIPSAEIREQAQARRLRGEPLPLPAYVSTDLGQLICKACMFKPQDRFASAEEMHRAFQNLQYRRENQGVQEPEQNPGKWDRTEAEPQLQFMTAPAPVQTTPEPVQTAPEPARTAPAPVRKASEKQAAAQQGRTPLLITIGYQAVILVLILFCLKDIDATIPELFNPGYGGECMSVLLMFMTAVYSLGLMGYRQKSGNDVLTYRNLLIAGGCFSTLQACLTMQTILNSNSMGVQQSILLAVYMDVTAFQLVRGKAENTSKLYTWYLLCMAAAAFLMLVSSSSILAYRSGMEVIPGVAFGVSIFRMLVYIISGVLPMMVCRNQEPGMEKRMLKGGIFMQTEAILLIFGVQSDFQLFFNISQDLIFYLYAALMAAALLQTEEKKAGRLTDRITIGYTAVLMALFFLMSYDQMGSTALLGIYFNINHFSHWAAISLPPAAVLWISAAAVTAAALLSSTSERHAATGLAVAGTGFVYLLLQVFNLYELQVTTVSIVLMILYAAVTAAELLTNRNTSEREKNRMQDELFLSKARELLMQYQSTSEGSGVKQAVSIVLDDLRCAQTRSCPEAENTEKNIIHQIFELQKAQQENRSEEEQNRMIAQIRQQIGQRERIVQMANGRQA